MDNTAGQSTFGLLAPLAHALGINDVWAFVAGLCFLLFVIFFACFIANRVKIRHLKRQVIALHEQNAGMAAMARLQPLAQGDDDSIESAIYVSLGEDAEDTQDISAEMLVGDEGETGSEEAVAASWQNFWDASDEAENTRRAGHRRKDAPRHERVDEPPSTPDAAPAAAEESVPAVDMPPAEPDAPTAPESPLSHVIPRI